MDDELYERLDEKRWKSRSSFQQIGVELFTRWLEDSAGSSTEPRKTGPTSAGVATGVNPERTVDVSRLSRDQIQRLNYIADLLRTPESELDSVEIRFRNLLEGFVDESIAKLPKQKPKQHRKAQ